MKNKLLLWIGLLLLFTLLSRGCSQSNINPTNLKTDDVVLYTTKSTYGRGAEVILNIQNNTATPFTLASLCPEEPLDVYFYQNGDWQAVKSSPELDCTQIPKELSIKPQEKKSISYRYWRYSLFSPLGRYQIKTTINDKTYSSNEFTLKKEGIFRNIWQNLIYRPIYNTLIFFAKVIPNHSLGLSILLLTLLIRTLLLIPSQKGLKAQKKLQEVQPKIKNIQEKHKGDQQKIAEETMKIWKEHKVNPLGSCLPLFIQLPILIALFYVIQDVYNPDNHFLLYAPLSSFSLKDLNVNFLNLLNLTQKNTFVLPLIVGGLQFFQIKLSLLKNQKQASSKKEVATTKDKKDSAPDQMEIMNKTMTYVMPVMITVFTASVPSGIGLYWGISTLYGIGQQLVVNYQSDQKKSQVKVVK